VRQVVDNPVDFTPLPYGLLSVAQAAPQGSVHWQQGITYQTRCINDGATTFSDCFPVSGSPEPGTKEPTEYQDLRGASAFTVRTMFECSAVGLEDVDTVAQDALAQTEQFQAEFAFWTGIVDEQANIAFPHLAASVEYVDADTVMQTVPVTGTAADVACGIGYLEEQIGLVYAGSGVIHVPSVALATLQAWNLVTERSGALFSPSGHRYVVGAGYPGTGPAGDAIGQCDAWLFATGPVFVYRGAVKTRTLKESIDRSSNTVQMHAERTMLLGWSCAHAGVNVTLGVPVPA
jgi:hypothetical protein